MANAYITGLTAVPSINGAELLEVSKLSPTVTITAATISAQASDNSYNDSGSGFITAGFAVGDRVRVQGFTGNVANNIFVGVVTARTAGKLTIGGTDGDVIVDDAAGESVTITKWLSYRATSVEIAGAAEATNAEIWAGAATGKNISPRRLYTASEPQALTSGATITPDGNNGFNFSLTLAHNATLANPSNFKVGQSGVIEITQDGTGSRTLNYGSNWKFPGGAPVLSTVAGTIDALFYSVTASGRILANLSKGYSS